MSPAPLRALGCAALLVLLSAVPTAAVARSTPAGPSVRSDGCVPTGAPQPAARGGDPTLLVDGCGHEMYADVLGDVRTAPRAPSYARAGTDQPPTGSAPDPVALSSDPGAAVTLYLDFTGEQIADTYWNDSYGAMDGSPFWSRPFRADGDRDARTWSAEENREIREIWAGVVDDFAPFEVNVTTVRPPEDDLLRTDEADTRHGVHVVISSGSPISATCVCSGIAHVGLLGFTGDQRARSRYVFAFTDASTTQDLVHTVTHEVGHAAGLVHDGLVRPDGERVQYYAGHGPWLPIMGAGSRPMAQWSAGEYPGASSTQDDLAIIGTFLPPVADDVPDDRSAPLAPLAWERPRGAPSTGPSWKRTSAAGVITTRDDRDVFRVDVATRARLAVAATSGTFAPGLDVGLTLLDDAGRQLRDGSLTTRTVDGRLVGADAYLETGLVDPGTYYLVVDGVGQATPEPGWSDYGSLGAYRLQVSAWDEGFRAVHSSGSGPATLGDRDTRESTVLGGAPVDSWTRTDGSLPPGMFRTVRGQTNRVLVLDGWPEQRGRWRVEYTARTADGRRVVVHRTIRVE